MRTGVTVSGTCKKMVPPQKILELALLKHTNIVKCFVGDVTVEKTWMKYTLRCPGIKITVSKTETINEKISNGPGSILISNGKITGSLSAKSDKTKHCVTDLNDRVVNEALQKWKFENGALSDICLSIARAAKDGSLTVSFSLLKPCVTISVVYLVCKEGGVEWWSTTEVEVEPELNERPPKSGGAAAVAAAAAMNRFYEQAKVTEVDKIAGGAIVLTYLVRFLEFVAAGFVIAAAP